MYRYTEESIIGYQLNDPFVDKLVDKLSGLRYTVKNDSDATAECKDLCDLINSRFGDILETFEVEYEEEFNAYMSVPVFFKMGVMFTSGGKHTIDIKKELRKNGEASGWREAIDKFRPVKNLLVGINFRDAKIENGIKEGCKLGMTLGALISDVSDRSLAALVLHEIGHLFHHYALSIGNVFTNALLVETAKQLALNDDPLIKVEIISRVNDEFFDRNIPLKDVEELAQDETNRNAILRLAYAGHRYVRSELGFDFYDSRSHEQVADKFAVRFGLGGDLADAFSKVLSQGINGYLLTGYFSMFYAGVGGALVGSLALAGALTVGVGGLILLIAIFNKPPKYQLYDGSEERIKMLRTDFISALKKKQMDKETVSYVIGQLDSIEESLVKYEKKLSVHDGVSRAADRLVAYFNGTLREETINKDLERMANNELFVATKRIGLN